MLSNPQESGIKLLRMTVRENHACLHLILLEGECHYGKNRETFMGVTTLMEHSIQVLFYVVERIALIPTTLYTP